MRLQLIAGGSDEGAVLIELERSVARVGQLTVRLEDLEEAIALNHYVQRVVGFRKVALREDDFVGSRPRPESELEAGGHRGLLARGSARLHHILVQQVLKLRATGLIARGVGVG